MWLGPVNLPSTLVDAQARGTLIVFAGAGVSMSPPADLPNFEQLVLQVAATAPLVRGEREPLDRFLGRLEIAGVNVQQRTRDILSAPSSAPTALHRDLLRLFSSPATVRIVTTNFDPHFTTGAMDLFAGALPETYVGPALPLGRDTCGLVYLHGALHARHPLVLTDADFGRAYLTDGWARRFLVEMFQRYTVLFVGYSHDDPITGHLARSLPPGTARYALTSPGRDAEWRHLGITPVEFPYDPGPDRYAELPRVVSRWAEHARMGVFDHEPRVRRLAQSPPPIDPETVDYLSLVVLKDLALTRMFADVASAPAWLEWMDAQGHLAPLFQRDAPLTDVQTRLAWWLAERFAVAHAGAALTLFRARGGTPHHALGYTVLWTLFRHTPTVPAPIVAAWIGVLLQAVPNSWYSRELTNILTLCSRPEDVTTALLLVAHLTRPQMALEQPWPSFASSTAVDGVTDDEDGDEPVEAVDETVDEPVPAGDVEATANVNEGGSAQPSALALRASVGLAADTHQFRKAWTAVIRPRLAEMHGELLPVLTAHLVSAHRLFASVRNADAQFDPWSSRRSAIEPHPQDAYPSSGDLLIDLTREVVEYAVHITPARAIAQFAAWFESPVVLLRRLAVHAAIEHPAFDPDVALQQVIDGRWLADGAAKHEVFRLVARAYPDAAPAMRTALIRYSLQPGVWLPDDVENNARDDANEPTRRRLRDMVAYAEYNFAVWLARSAPSCEIAAAHLAAMQARKPEWQPREFPDLSSWSGGVVSRGTRSPISTDALLSEPADARLDDLRTYEGGSDDWGEEPSRPGLLDAVRTAAGQSSTWGAALATALAREGAREWDLWTATLAGWTAAEFAIAEWRDLLALLDGTPDVVEGIPRTVGDLLRRGIERRDDGIRVDDVTLVERLADRVYTAADALPLIEHRAQDSWRHVAINHEAGRIAEVWLHALSHRVRHAGGVDSEAWLGLPDDYQRRFSDVIRSSDGVAAIAALRLAGQIRFLLGVDRSWTLANLVPLFDWSRDAQRAEQVFHGLLGMGTLNDEVWDVLRPAYVGAFAHSGDALAAVQDGLVYDLVWAAVYGTANPLDTGWLAAFITQADEATRVRWAEQVGRTLETLPVDRSAELWDRWIDRYWADRITGVPLQLSTSEANAMVGWVLGLRAVLPAVVARVVKSPVVPDDRDLIFFSLHEDGAVTAEQPIAVLTLVRFLLEKRTQPLYDCAYLAGIVREACRAGADRSTLLAVCGQLAQSGCSEAPALRREVDAAHPQSP